jgi:hypothetical protein
MYHNRMHFDLGVRLFDIPVYRVTPERWAEEREAYIQRHVGADAPEASLRRWHMIFEDQFGEYAYNQIMGWVHVGWVGGWGHIKFYYFRVPQKRIGLHFRRRGIREFGKIAEFHVGYQATSADMISMIRDRLIGETRGHSSLRGRYLDLEVFDNLAPALDLKALLRD